MVSEWEREEGGSWAALASWAGRGKQASEKVWAERSRPAAWWSFSGREENKRERKEGEREVGRRKQFWAEGRAGPRARKERREGEQRGRGLGRSFIFFETPFSNFQKF
jgi:hypothetical protein